MEDSRSRLYISKRASCCHWEREFRAANGANRAPGGLVCLSPMFLVIPVSVLVSLALAIYGVI